MAAYSEMTLSAMAAALEAGEVSSVDLVDDAIKAAEASAPLNIVVTDSFERARAAAKASDARRATDEDARPLDGVPVAVKDLFCTDGVRTTAGSKILESFVPPYESTVSAKLADAGAISIGKLNLDEFAMGSSNEHSMFGACVNPWSEVGGSDLVPGGSSGGSAAAVAARIVPGTLGTDTGGSIRQPAAYCSVVGMKPTYGRCSRWGIIAYASSLDQAGAFGRSVSDVALMLQAIMGHDPKDSTSAPQAVPDLRAPLTQDVKGLRIGIPKEFRTDALDPEIAATWDKGAQWLREQGAEIVEVSLPHTQAALAAYYIIAPAEASSNLARYDGVRYGTRILPDNDSSLNGMYAATRAGGFGREVQRRIMIGTYVLSAGYYDAYYVKAQKVRSLVAKDYADAFESVDALLTPTAPSPAFPIGQPEDDPTTMYLNDVFTTPISLAGLPGLSVPAGLSASGLPLGLQVVGKVWDEATVIRVGAALEQAADFTAVPPRAILG